MRERTGNGRMHRQRSFATAVTRCCIYSYTPAAPTSTGVVLVVSSFDERRPRDREPEERRVRKRGEERRDEKDRLGNSGHLYVLPPPFAAALVAPLRSSHLPAKPANRGEHGVTSKRRVSPSEIVR